jgi:hypothetical protein
MTWKTQSASKCQKLVVRKYLGTYVKGLNAQDGGAPATELVAGTGRGGGVCGRAPNGEGGD